MSKSTKFYGTLDNITYVERENKMRNMKILGIAALLVAITIGVVVPATAAPKAQLAAVDLVLWSKESPELMEAIGFEAAFAAWASSAFG